MDLRKLIKEYMAEMRVIQLATSVNNKPWACNIHFYADDDFNIYWISSPERRHSQDIEQNPNVAAVIKIHEDTPEEPYVIGLSAEGKASLLDTEQIKKIGAQYINKLGKDPAMLNDLLSGKNPHLFYRLKVTNFVLFDTKIFPADPRQELTL